MQKLHDIHGRAADGFGVQITDAARKHLDTGYSQSLDCSQLGVDFTPALAGSLGNKEAKSCCVVDNGPSQIVKIFATKGQESWQEAAVQLSILGRRFGAVHGKVSF